jgi:hypothetical protein
MTSGNGLFEPGGLQEWLERANPILNGAAPVDLLDGGNWIDLADLIDDMGIGAGEGNRI